MQVLNHSGHGNRLTYTLSVYRLLFRIFVKWSLTVFAFPKLIFRVFLYANKLINESFIPHTTISIIACRVRLNYSSTVIFIRRAYQISYIVIKISLLTLWHDVFIFNRCELSIIHGNDWLWVGKIFISKRICHSRIIFRYI